MFYRGIDPIDKGYAELKYLYDWHELISKANKEAADNA